MSKAKQFEEYGTRDAEIIIVRFNSSVPHFDKAKFDGKTYRVFEHTFVPDKAAIRLQKVVE